MTNREDQALKRAEQIIRNLERDERRIRDRSVSLVIEQHGHLRHGLVLLHAATLIAIPSAIRADPRRQAVLRLAGLQEDLLGAGWRLMLDGHYAAAGQLTRTIFELIDYIPAAARSVEGAQKLLANEEWRVSEARKMLVRTEFQGAAPAVVQRWVEGRKAQQGQYTKLAHVTGPLTMAVAHLQADSSLALIGHDFNPAWLRGMANEYAQLSVNACLGVGVAHARHLPDARPLERDAAGATGALDPLPGELELGAGLAQPGPQPRHGCPPRPEPVHPPHLLARQLVAAVGPPAGTLDPAVEDLRALDPPTEPLPPLRDDPGGPGPSRRATPAARPPGAACADGPARRDGAGPPGSRAGRPRAWAGWPRR
jgi:hypothetical protein